MDEDTLKNDGVAIVIILVAFAFLALIGYLVGLGADEEVITGEDVIVSSTIPNNDLTTSTSPIEP